MNWLKYKYFGAFVLLLTHAAWSQDSLQVPVNTTIGRINTDELIPTGISVLDLRILEKQGTLFSFYPKFIDEGGQTLELSDREFEDLQVKVIHEPRIGFDLKKDPIKKALDIGMRPFYCECFTSIGPDSAVYELSVPQSSDTRSINVTGIVQTNIRDVSLWLKCKEFILFTLLALLLAAYILGIIRKPRFGPNAYIRHSRNFYLSTGAGKKYPLMTNFVNRWLVPYIAEKRNVQGLLFEAGSSHSHVYLSKKSQKKSMIVSSTEILNPGKRKIKILNKQYIESQAGNSKIVHEYNQR